MSVGFLKRLLSILNVVGVLAIGGAGFGFWSHREVLAQQPRPIDFIPPEKPPPRGGTSIENIGIKLGRFQEKVAVQEVKKEEPKEEKIESVLASLGEIKGAVVSQPPYGSVLPSIIFEFTDGRKPAIKTIALNEALEERLHPDPELAFYGWTVPVRYKFVGCEPDPENPGWTYFLFDMKCDGTDIQKARWKGEKTVEETKVASAPVKDRVSGLYIGDIEEAEAAAARRAEEAKARTTEPTTVQPVEQPEEATPAPIPQPYEPGRQPSGAIFEQEDGAFAPTDEGIRYLKDNYQDVLKETRTATYRDSAGNARGIQITGIKTGSLANEFGIYKDDVILSINNQTVTRQAEAVNVVKSELNKTPRPTTLRVRILRNGRELTKEYDTRDPETRRRAKEAFRHR